MIADSLRQITLLQRRRRQQEQQSPNCSCAQEQNSEFIVQESLGSPDRKSGFGRLCPMCEALFPVSVGFEDFEHHVMEHFNLDENDTLINCN